ncbi:putative LRR receptor-like serine/threonine-protein kinase [Cocos nucifera]|uniref:Receptor kinase-like protein Xa21 n=1 Tax=Cocos nucifera TaxID=13894 RepID=A0A8K0IMR5_COCNU|nr:putative LRR receptor-like serine/threonine-protein kinase [Cocos nucifera]
MDPALRRMLELLLARRRQAKALPVHPSSFRGTTTKASDVAPLATLTSASVGDENPPLVVEPVNSVMEVAMGVALSISLEEILMKESLIGDASIEGLLVGMVEVARMVKVAEMIRPSELAKIIEVIDLPEQAIPDSSLSLVGTQAESSQPVPSSPSAVETLKTMVEFLEGHLSFEERRALDGEGAQCQMAGAFRFLALIGHYLVNFTRITFGASALELAKAREEIDRLRYLLEQEKAANAKLVKKVDYFEKALREARDTINRRDNEIRRAHARNEDLKRRRSKAERNCHRAHDDIKHLRRMLREVDPNLLKITATSLVAKNSKSISDHLALISFKSDIYDDPYGVLSSWDNKSLHFCRWQGVICGSRHPERVIALDLPSLRLAGTISPSIANLSFLRRLILQDNRLHGSIPQDLGYLHRLQHLNLSVNSLEGQIPSSLGNCEHLITLDLGKNLLNGQVPHELGSLPQLTALILRSNNLIGGIPTSFSNLSSLDFLNLSNNTITGSIPRLLGNLSSITIFVLAKNSLSGSIPSSLCGLPSLAGFDVAHNQLSGMIPPCFYNLSSIQVLSVGWNSLRGTIPSDIGSTLAHLQNLFMASNQFTGLIPSSLSNASGLSRIQFQENHFHGKIPHNLGALQNLSLLLLSRNQLVAKNADDWSFLIALTNCSKLTILDIDDNNLAGVLPNSISNLSIDMRFLYFGLNQISGSLPSDIGNLKNLVVISMGRNLLTGNIPASLGNLNALHELDVSENKFSGQIPPSLGNISQLNQFFLSGNTLSGSIPIHLGNCRNLQVLDLSYNQLTGTIPIEILSLSSLSEGLDLSHNALHGNLPSEIGNLVNVNTLDVSENRLYGEIPDSIGKCTVLVNLDISGNFFEGVIPTSLSNLKGLQILGLSSNHLSGQIPAYFQIFHSLQFLNLSFNNLEGEVPLGGVFANMSTFSVIGNQNICGGIHELHLPPCSSTQPHGQKHKAAILVVTIIVAGGVLGLTLILFFILLYQTQKLRKRHPSMATMRTELIRVSYAELVKATDGFSSANLIGVGSYGSVYKGVMEWYDEKMVAIKILNLQQQEASRSFIAECEALRSIRHRNLVKIITACSSVDFRGNDFKALVLEFMENGSLEQWLHPEVNERCPMKNLNLEQRVSIAIDVASVLDYLHHHSPVPIVHCDLKPSNILLDDDMTAHVSDFGLAKFLSESTDSFSISASLAAIKGSVGYIAPEYGLGSEVSTQGDVYSYGILLLEMFTGKRPIDETFNESLDLHQFVEMAFPTQIMNIVDPQLIREEEYEVINDIQQRGSSWMLYCHMAKRYQDELLHGFEMNEMEEARGKWEKVAVLTPGA